MGDYYFVNDRARIQLGNDAGIGPEKRNFWIEQ
jgi:hypothetical protein